MLSESESQRLDLLYEDWLCFAPDGRLLERSDGLAGLIVGKGIAGGGSSVRDFFELEEEQHEAFFGAWEGLMGGAACSMTLQLKAIDGERKFVFAPLFREGNEVAAVIAGVVRERRPRESCGADFTGSVKNTLNKLSEMKELFRDIARANKQLERALQSAKNQIELARAESEAKTDFLANMSHEIRTPMNAVIGFCDLLSSTELTREQEEYVDAINQSGQLLIKLIGQVLDYSKIESGSLDLEREELRLEQIVLEIRAIMSARLGDKEITFTLDTDALTSQPLYGDETRVKQILLNLLGNAFKFTRRGKVSLKVESTPSEYAGYQCIRGTVEDTGIGVASEMVERLFDPFAQANCRIAREFGGSGLGLAICKRLCAAMHGDVWVERTELGKGSVFAFEIHLATKDAETIAFEDMTPKRGGVEENDHQARSSEASKAGRLRLLVVDDNPNNLLITSKLSQHLGYEAETVRNGVDALRRLREEAFDIVLMDVRMAPLSGIETTRRIREGEAGEQCASAYIIAVTAHALQGDRERCLESGMNDYLSKPLTLDRLEESLKRARSELSLD